MREEDGKRRRWSALFYYGVLFSHRLPKTFLLFSRFSIKIFAQTEKKRYDKVLKKLRRISVYFRPGGNGE